MCLAEALGLAVKYTPQEVFTKEVLWKTVNAQSELIAKHEQRIRELETTPVNCKDEDRMVTLDAITARRPVRVIKEAVCFNQGELTQYVYFAAELHRKLKEALHQEPTNVNRLGEVRQGLIAFLKRNLERITKKNFQFIKHSFGDRHAINPRICVKGSSLIDGEEMVVQLFRDEAVSYLANYPLSSNSGFIYSKENGTYFESRDIAKDVALGKYRNARLDSELAAGYWTQRFGNDDVEAVPASDSSEQQADDNVKVFVPDWDWVKCWRTHASSPAAPPADPDPTSCYKSTLIIPMTYWNVDLEPAFRTLIKTKDIGRTIFGFLCFDHVESYYFTDQDVDIGYIFADLLSLYFVTMAIYTEFSAAFEAVSFKVNETNK